MDVLSTSALFDLVFSRTKAALLVLDSKIKSSKHYHPFSLALFCVGPKPFGKAPYLLESLIPEKAPLVAKRPHEFVIFHRDEFISLFRNSGESFETMALNIQEAIFSNTVLEKGAKRAREEISKTTKTQK